MIALNIEMPKSCNDCPMYDDRWDYPTCYITNESRGYNFDIFNKRMPNCPLKEIKKCNLKGISMNKFKNSYNI